VPGFVERRAHQVVHGGVDDGEILGFALFQVFDASQQQAGVADQSAARFEDHLQAATGQLVEQRRQVGGDGWLHLLGVVLDTEAATEVEVVNVDAFSANWSTRARMRSSASMKGDGSSSCEPMWQSMPAISMWGSGGTAIERQCMS
jgi:hypothetical protein